MPRADTMFAPARLRHITILLATGGMALAGCGTDTSFPSLAPRPIEDESLTEPSVPPPPAGTPSDAAMADYAPIVAKARSADAEFRTTLSDARDALGQGRHAAAGSDAWLAAQTALSRVEAARNPVAVALSDLDAARNGDAPRTDSGRAAAVAKAFAEVQAIDAAEQRAVAEAMPPR